jgi:hypothetical protein
VVAEVLLKLIQLVLEVLLVDQVVAEVQLNQELLLQLEEQEIHLLQVLFLLKEMQEAVNQALLLMEVLEPVVAELLQQVLLVTHQLLDQVEQEHPMIFQEVQYLMLAVVEVETILPVVELVEQVLLVEQVVDQAVVVFVDLVLKMEL